VNLSDIFVDSNFPADSRTENVSRALNVSEVPFVDIESDAAHPSLVRQSVPDAASEILIASAVELATISVNGSESFSASSPVAVTGPLGFSGRLRASSVLRSPESVPLLQTDELPKTARFSEDGEDANSQGSSELGTYVGIGLGALLLLVVVAVVALLMRRKRGSPVPDDDDEHVELDLGTAASFEDDNIGEFISQIQTAGTGMHCEWTAQNFTDYQDIFAAGAGETTVWG
jgi:hypothetical protein